MLIIVSKFTNIQKATHLFRQIFSFSPLYGFIREALRQSLYHQGPRRSTKPCG